MTPNDADAYHGRGWSYAKMGEYDRAIKDYNEALRINPANLKAVANRRLADVQNGDYQLAMVDQVRYLWLKFGKVDGMVLLVLLVVSIALALQFGIKRARRIDVIGRRPQP